MKMQNEVVDERQKQILTQSLANAGIFMMVCVIISSACKVAATGDPGWEFWSMLGACVVLLISRRLLGDVEQPKDIMNRPLPVGNSKEDRNARKKDYAIQSAIFALACVVMDIVLFAFGEHEYIDMEMTEYFFPTLSKGTAIAVTAVGALITGFVISYIVEYLVGEHFTVKRYNKMLTQLDEDD